MRNLLLLLVLACCAQASIFPILSGSISSDLGVSGVGGYSSGVSVSYALEQYDRSDVGQLDLRQDVYFRYSYVFAATHDPAAKDTAPTFSYLILALAADCGADSECIFGIQSEDATLASGDIKLYTHDEGSGNPGLADPIHGIRMDKFFPAGRTLSLSFFSNRIPDGDGRIYMRGGEDYLISDPGALITPNTHVRPQTEPPAHTPEPMTMGLLGTGLASLIVLHRTRRQS